MSRIGKQPIELLSGVTVNIDGQEITVKGTKGELTWRLPSAVLVEQSDDKLIVKPKRLNHEALMLWGTTRAVLANMVRGVKEGYEKRLEIEGVGYRASVQGGNLVLSVGFSHPVEVSPPEGINFTVEKNTVVVSGIDKVLVGETAAKVRAVRKPEPYKGKGIRYQNEIIRRKTGKKAAGAAGTE